MIGIYMIRNQSIGTVYIGHSKSIEQRWYYHSTLLNANKHPSQKLQEDWNDIGPTNFEFVTLEICTKHNLVSAENKWMKLTNALNSYNYNLEKSFYSPERHISQMKNQTYSMTEDLIEKLDRLSDETGLPKSDLMRRALENYLQKREEDKT